MCPKISVITINRNDAEGLRKTIKSVVSQTFSDFEYIVIDGASTDGSVDVIKKDADRITYWVSEPDSGIYNAMNKGIGKAKGAYCLFLNSGDYLYQDTVLENVVNSSPTEDIVFGNILIDYGNHKEPVIYNDKITLKLLFQDSLPHPSAFIKKRLFDEFGFYDESFQLAGDYEFFLRALVLRKCSYKHVDTSISVFNTLGISRNRDFLDINLKERRRAQELYFSLEIIELFYDLNNQIIKLERDYREVNYDYNVLLKSKPVRFAKWLRTVFPRK
ncbi:MAG TPA: glycosyltransferase family 2 protein [Bacteroidales bacterium]|nr:glycosyltransferase family 2 protein [Bacteroidales bacterium]